MRNENIGADTTVWAITADDTDAKCTVTFNGATVFTINADGSFTVPTFTTANRNLIPDPRDGTIIFNTTTNKLNVYCDNGAGWEAVTSA